MTTKEKKNRKSNSSSDYVRGVNCLFKKKKKTCVDKLILFWYNKKRESVVRNVTSQNRWCGYISCYVGYTYVGAATSVKQEGKKQTNFSQRDPTVTKLARCVRNGDDGYGC